MLAPLRGGERRVLPTLVIDHARSYDFEISTISDGYGKGIPLALSHHSPEGARACLRRLGGRAKWLKKRQSAFFQSRTNLGVRDC